MKALCYCGSLLEYEDCCNPFLTGERLPLDCEQLMRSRFSAFATMQYRYIIETQQFIAQQKTDYATLEASQANVKWLKLEVIKSSQNSGSSSGKVEFKAWYRQPGAVLCLHEESIFTLQNKRWIYTDAAYSKTTNVSAKSACPCGSGKKTKRCCTLKS